MEVTTATARAQVVGRKLFGAFRETLSESVLESLPLLCVELLHHSWLILPASPHANGCRGQCMRPAAAALDLFRMTSVEYLN